ncbi:hypothetical protein ACH40E_04445 [Streptomyces acidicola]|uniref:hypothetical protein n=1 Tax=Streptomyces acidicola TaxID=2596892 RepID=UPI0037A9B444
MGVLISHRLAAFVGCDRICVFDARRIVGSGSHDDLMALGGSYAAMFTVQAEG